MEKHNLKYFGVEEINAKMSEKINGGLLWFAAKAYAGALLVELAVDGWAQCKADFLEGWHKAE
jgi:hypothetical protein